MHGKAYFLSRRSATVIDFVASEEEDAPEEV